MKWIGSICAIAGVVLVVRAFTVAAHGHQDPAIVLAATVACPAVACAAAGRYALAYLRRPPQRHHHRR